MFLLLLVFEAARLSMRALLLILSLHFLRAAWTSFRELDPERPPEPEQWPRVTVQLPLKNEFYVAERVIRCAAAMDYPRDRLDIQVLDDSDDETVVKIQEVVRQLQDEGARIEVLHRDEPVGYKAGALNAGLERTDADLVAIFDADCVPAKDFLRRTVPFFQREKVACVQVRWSFLNRDHSLLTRLQAMVLDGLFTIDQFARAASHLPLQFNGTNGLWRTQTIREVGGWRGEILAEDADLSFRAHLEGWQLVHLRQYAVPTELPEDMASFRTQQHRWSQGSAQLLRAIGLRVLQSRLPLRSKLMMFMHMGRHAIDPFIVMAAVSSPLTTLYGVPYLVEYTVPVNSVLFAMLGAGCAAFYGAALRYVRASQRNLVLIPLIIPLAIGLSLAYTLAFAAGLVRRGGPFIRTPKAGSERIEKGPRYRTRKPLLALLEIAIGIAHTYFTVLALGAELYAASAFFAMLSLSFLWVGLGTLASPGVGRDPA